MLNNVSIQGRLTKPIEVNYVGPKNTPVVKNTVACEQDRKDSEGNKITDFIEFETWRGSAEYLAKYANKGDMIIIQGRVKQESWKDKNTNNNKSKLLINATNVYKVSYSESNDQGFNQVPEQGFNTYQEQTSYQRSNQGFASQNDSYQQDYYNAPVFEAQSQAQPQESWSVPEPPLEEQQYDQPNLNGNDLPFL